MDYQSFTASGQANMLAIEIEMSVQCPRLCHNHCVSLRYSSSNALTCLVDCSSESSRKGEQRLVYKTNTDLLISSTDIQRGFSVVHFHLKRYVKT